MSCVRSILIGLSVLSGSLSAEISAAQELGADTATDTDAWLDLATNYEVVVTGAREARRLGDATVATEVVNRAEIEASGAVNVGEILEEKSGIELTPTGAGRGTRGKGIRINGMDSRQVLILVDGQRAVGRIGGDLDPTRFDLENVERIEVVKGASSALYGSDAIGGVINIITRKAKAPFEGDIMVMGGGFDTEGGACCTADVAAGVGMRYEDLRNHISGGFHYFDNFDLDPEVEGDTAASYQEFNISDTGSYKIDDAIELAFGGDYRRADQEALDLVGRARFLRTQRTDVWSIHGGPKIELAGGSELSVRARHSRFRLQILQDQIGADVLDSLDDIRHELTELNVQYQRTFFSDHDFSMGFDGLLEAQTGALIAADAENRQRGAVYAQDEWTILDEDFYLVAVFGIRGDLDSTFGSRVSPRISTRFDPTDDIVVRASYGWGFRAPDFEELFLEFENPGSGYFVIGNQDLQPETSQNVTASVEYRSAKWASFTVSLFWNEIDNLIDTLRGTPSPPPGMPSGDNQSRFDYVNVSSAFSRGGELGAHLSFAKRFKIDLGYALTDTGDRGKDRPLSGRALHRGTVSFRYRERDLGLSGTLRSAIVGPRLFYTSTGQPDEEIEERAPAHIMMDARVEKTIGEHLSAFVGMDNILGVGEPKFLPVPPRTAYVGLTGRYAVHDE